MITENQLADDPARKRKLDDLFANQPFLSTTMKAAQLRDVGDDISLVRVSSVLDDDDDIAAYGAPDLHMETSDNERERDDMRMPLWPEYVGPPRNGDPAPLTINRDTHTIKLGAAGVHIPSHGKVHLELLLDLELNEGELRPMSPTAPEVLTLTETARFLRISQSTVRALVKRGKLQCGHIGRRPRFRHAALLEFLTGTETPNIAVDDN